jgi:hypothetical protein
MTICITTRGEEKTPFHEQQEKMPSSHVERAMSQTIKGKMKG